jgi:hypothetical protein
MKSVNQYKTTTAKKLAIVVLNPKLAVKTVFLCLVLSQNHVKEIEND